MATLHWTFALWLLADCRKEQHIAFALMIALVMKMRPILRQRMAERRFPKQDEARQAFLLARSHPPLRVGVEMRRPRRQWDAPAPGGIDELLQGGTVLPVPVRDERLAR